MSASTSLVPARLKRLKDGRIRACCGRSSPDCPGELGYLVTELKKTKSDRLPFTSARDWWEQQEETARRSWKREASPLDPPEVGLLRYQMTQPSFLMEVLNEAGSPSPGEWVLTHPAGLRRTDDGAFDVIRGRRAEDGTRVGRRPVPDMLDVNPRHRISAPFRQQLIGSGRRAIVGQIPSLPAVVVCPVCGLHNEVVPPVQ